MRPSLIYHLMSPFRMLEQQQWQFYRLQEALLRPFWKLELAPSNDKDNSFTNTATLNYGDNKFEASIDVRDYKPEDISVKIEADNVISIEGRREQVPTERGYISSRFVKKYVLPKGHDVDKLESTLSSDGVLTITAPKLPANVDDPGRSIPIKKTGKPAAISGEKKDEDVQD